MSQEIMLNNNGIIAKVELDTKISTAKAYPRDVKKFLQNAEIQVTLDEEIAEECWYSLPGRDEEGNRIEGPSIRLAEIMRSAWGNIKTASRVVENDGKFITVEGTAWDLETNTQTTSELQISIIKRNGQIYTADMQTKASAGAQSKCLRNAIFSIIGKSYTNYLMKKAKNFAVGDQKTLSIKRKKILERFKSMNISEEKIFSYLNKKSIEEITLQDIEYLIGIGTAIKEGTIKIDDAFTDKIIESNSAQDLIKELLPKKETMLIEAEIVNKESKEKLDNWINSKSTANQ
jgi:hypothetical protein